jgi:hypothetical protein
MSAKELREIAAEAKKKISETTAQNISDSIILKAKIASKRGETSIIVSVTNNGGDRTRWIKSDFELAIPLLNKQGFTCEIKKEIETCHSNKYETNFMVSWENA